MASVLFAWECGGGLGHLLQITPLAESVAKRGHCVSVALRHLSTPAAAALGRAGVKFLQAPFKSTGRRPYRRTPGFAHVLANVGWGEVGELFALAYAWRNLLDFVRPDLVVFDHAPTALLAARGCDQVAKRVLIGSGFCCPTGTFPLPALISYPPPDPELLREDERCLLGRVNQVLAQWRRPPLERLGQLYSEVDETFLTTFPELEQYPGRTGAKYWGPVIGGGGEAPQWPEAGEGPRVFAYLKQSEAMRKVVGLLGGRRLPAVVYVDGLGESQRREMEARWPTVRFPRRRVDLRRAAAECDLAVLHAGQGATAAVLLAGKPMLQLPLNLEQRLTAEATVRMGAGERADANDAESVREKLDLMLAERGRYTVAAEAFATRHADFDPGRQVERMAKRVEQLMAGEDRGRERVDTALGEPGRAAPIGPGRPGSVGVSPRSGRDGPRPAVPAGVFCNG